MSALDNWQDVHQIELAGTPMSQLSESTSGIAPDIFILSICIGRSAYALLSMVVALRVCWNCCGSSPAMTDLPTVSSWKPSLVSLPRSAVAVFARLSSFLSQVSAPTDHGRYHLRTHVTWDPRHYPVRRLPAAKSPLSGEKGDFRRSAAEQAQLHRCQRSSVQRWIFNYLDFDEFLVSWSRDVRLRPRWSSAKESLLADNPLASHPHHDLNAPSDSPARQRWATFAELCRLGELRCDSRGPLIRSSVTRSAPPSPSAEPIVSSLSSMVSDAYTISSRC